MSTLSNLQAANAKLQADSRVALATRQAFAALILWANDVEARLGVPPPPPPPPPPTGAYGTGTFGGSTYG